MSDSYRALRLWAEKEPHCELVQVSVEELSPGDVVIAPEFSAINYKDAMAATGTAPILRVPTLIGGIDAAGTVVSSENDEFAVGQPVLVTGCGLSEIRDGGFAERLRVPSDTLIEIPSPFTARSAAILGTAGFTAMLAIERLQENRIMPGAGPVLVTGASGGVGSLAVLLLSRLGYSTIAMTGKPEAHDALRALGASEIREPFDLSENPDGLAKAEFAGAIDNLGGNALPLLVRMTQPWGSVVSIGRATGNEFRGSVIPFIIRGVSILGVTSANCPMERRHRAWSQLFEILQPEDLEPLVEDTIDLEDLPGRFPQYIEGHGRGRTLVRVRVGV